MNKLVLFIDGIKNKIYCAKMKRKYPDWEDDEYNCGDLKFIWGVKSYDDLSIGPANMYTMNDIYIDYDRDTELYSLSVETAYLFDGDKQDEAKYLEALLNEFTKFMVDNNYDTNEPYAFFLSMPETIYAANSIPELYTNFRIFVEGYKAIYGGKSDA